LIPKKKQKMNEDAMVDRDILRLKNRKYFFTRLSLVETEEEMIFNGLF